MTVPKLQQRVRDLVLSMLPHRLAMLTPQEAELGVHLRGNAPLYESLISLVRARMDARATQPVPAEPIDCRASMERDFELRWLLSRLEFIYKSPATLTHDSGEPPE